LWALKGYLQERCKDLDEGRPLFADENAAHPDKTPLGRAATSYTKPTLGAVAYDICLLDLGLITADQADAYTSSSSKERLSASKADMLEIS
jgi:hypothetical protein